VGERRDEEAIGKGDVDEQPTAEENLGPILDVQIVLLSDTSPDLFERFVFILSGVTLHIVDTFESTGEHLLGLAEQGCPCGSRFEIGREVMQIEVADRRGARSLFRLLDNLFHLPPEANLKLGNRLIGEGFARAGHDRRQAPGEVEANEAGERHDAEQDGKDNLESAGGESKISVEAE
jgi:hypothetical protein